MTIRKGKLYKPCKHCGNYFEPETKFSKVCSKCFDLANKIKEEKYKIYN